MSIYKRKSGKWAVVIAKEPGSIERTSIGTYATKRLAQTAERDALSARDRGIDIAPSDVTVGDVINRYIDDCRVRGVGQKTIQEYTGIARRAIEPHLGKIKFRKLRPARIAEWHAVLKSSGGKDRKVLSARSVGHADALLRGAAAWAHRLQLISLNIMVSVKPPITRRGQVRALSEDELVRVLKVARDSRWGPFTALAIATGARRGELTALDWDDFDAEKGTLLIRASMSQTKGLVEKKGTKTDRVRVALLAPFAIEELRRQRAIQAADQLRASPGHYHGSGAIFTDPLGSRYKPMQASDGYRRTVAEKAQVPTGLHVLRHTAITMLLVDGVDVRTVAGIAGHSSPIMTLQVYGHLVDSVTRAATERLGTALERLASKEA